MAIGRVPHTKTKEKLMNRFKKKKKRHGGKRLCAFFLSAQTDDLKKGAKHFLQGRGVIGQLYVIFSIRPCLNFGEISL